MESGTAEQVSPFIQIMKYLFPSIAGIAVLIGLYLWYKWRVAEDKREMESIKLESMKLRMDSLAAEKLAQRKEEENKENVNKESEEANTGREGLDEGESTEAK